MNQITPEDLAYVPSNGKKTVVSWVSECPDDAEPRSLENPWTASYEQTQDGEFCRRLEEKIGKSYYDDWKGDWVVVGAARPNDRILWIDVDTDPNRHEEVIDDPQKISFKRNVTTAIDTAGGNHAGYFFTDMADELDALDTTPIAGVDILGDSTKKTGVIGSPWHQDGYEILQLGSKVADPGQISDEESRTELISYDEDPILIEGSHDGSARIYNANYESGTALSIGDIVDVERGDNCAHPFHDSTSETNFRWNVGEDTWTCWRHKNFIGDEYNLLAIKFDIVTCQELHEKKGNYAEKEEQIADLLYALDIPIPDRLQEDDFDTDVFVPGFRPKRVDQYFDVPQVDGTVKDTMAKHAKSCRKKPMFMKDAVVIEPVGAGKSEYGFKYFGTDVPASMAIDNGRAGQMYEEAKSRWESHGASPNIAQSFEHDSPLWINPDDFADRSQMFWFAREEHPYYSREDTIDYELIHDRRIRGEKPQKLYNRAYNFFKTGRDDARDPERIDADLDSDQCSIFDFYDKKNEPNALPEEDRYREKRAAVGETNANIGHPAHCYMPSFSRDRAIILDDTSVDAFRSQFKYAPTASRTPDGFDSTKGIYEYLDYHDLDIDPFNMSFDEADEILNKIWGGDASDETLLDDTEHTTTQTHRIVAGLAILKKSKKPYAEWSGWTEEVRVTHTDETDEQDRRVVKVNIWAVPEELKNATKILVLSATPYLEGWDTFFEMLGRDYEIEAPEDGAFQAAIAEQFNEIVQLSNYLHPGHGSNAPRPERAKEALERMHDQYGEKPLFVSTKKHLEECKEELDLEELTSGWVNYAQAKNTNEHAEEKLVYLGTAPVPPDDEIKHMASFAGGDAERSGQGSDIIWSSPAAQHAYEYYVHDMIYQAIGRVARIDGGGIAWVDTCAVPSWIPRQVPEGVSDALVPRHWYEALQDVPESPTLGEIMEACDVKERQAYNIKEVVDEYGELRTQCNEPSTNNKTSLQSPKLTGLKPESRPPVREIRKPDRSQTWQQAEMVRIWADPPPA